MKVEIWSDIVCPFCYIGKRKFEKALDGFGAKDKVEIVWRSFQLDPDMENIPGQSVHEYLGKRKGVSTDQGKQMNDAMAKMAGDVGLEYNFDKAIISNTLHAHRLLHLAKTKGVQNDMKERLFRAYYTEGKNIGDEETLGQLGVEVGLKASDIKNMLAGETFKEEVLQDQHIAAQVGARGVPFFVFNDKYAVSGAQPVEVFAQVLNKVWEEEKPVQVDETNSTGICTTDGVCN